jgi:hypothetical protein
MVTANIPHACLWECTATNLRDLTALEVPCHDVTLAGNRLGIYQSAKCGFV